MDKDLRSFSVHALSNNNAQYWVHIFVINHTGIIADCTLLLLNAFGNEMYTAHKLIKGEVVA